MSTRTKLLAAPRCCTTTSRCSAKELGTVGAALDKAKDAHSSALKRLREGGKGSVLLQVQSLAEMGAPVKKQLSLLEGAGDFVDEAAEPEAPAAAQNESGPAKSPSVVPLKART